MSSVAETIMFIFQADAMRLDRGLNHAQKTGEKLEKQMIDTDSAAESLGNNLINLAKSAGATLGAMVAWDGIKALVTGTAEVTNEVTRMAARNNMAVETYAALRDAVGATGAELEEFQSGMEAFAEKVEDPTKKLDELATEFEKLTHFQALQKGQELGLSPSTIALLEKGKDAFHALLEEQKQLGSITKEQSATAREFQQAQKANALIWDSIRRSIGLAILPAFTSMLELFQKLGRWVRENQRVVILFFAGAATVLTMVYLPAIYSAITATLAFLAPWLGAAAIFAAVGAVFGLLVDDALSFLDGQDSMIGELSKKWPVIGENVKAIASTLRTLWDIAQGFGAFLRDAFTGDASAAFEAFKRRVVDALTSFAAANPAVESLVATVSDAFSKLGDVVGMNLDDVKAIAEAWVQGMGALFSFVGDMIASGPQAAFENLGSAVRRIIADISSQFPALGSAFQQVGDTMASAVQGATSAWEILMSVIQKVVGVAAGAVEMLKSGADKVKSWFGEESTQAPQQDAQPSAAPMTRGDVPLVAATDGQPVDAASASGYGPAAPPRVDPTSASGYGPAAPPPVTLNVEKGARQLEQARSEPLASTTSNAISNTNSSNSTSYTQQIGRVDVHTSATDGQGVAKDLGSDLGSSMRSAIAQFDDGVQA